MKKKAIRGAGDARIIGRYIVHSIPVVTYHTGKGKKGEIRGFVAVL